MVGATPGVVTKVHREGPVHEQVVAEAVDIVGRVVQPTVEHRVQRILNRPHVGGQRRAPGRVLASGVPDRE